MDVPRVNGMERPVDRWELRGLGLGFGFGTGAALGGEVRSAGTSFPNRGRSPIGGFKQLDRGETRCEDDRAAIGIWLEVSGWRYRKWPSKLKGRTGKCILVFPAHRGLLRQERHMFTRSDSRPITVVTGGAGFLGSHLTDRLLSEGHRVIGLDNLITGSVANIEHLAGNENYKFIRQDVSNYIFLPDDVDFVFHFASPASPIDYLEHPIPTLKVGALGTHNTLGLAKAKKATFLLASTSECYGDPLVHPQREDYWGNVNPIGPRGVYDEAKRFAEAMTMAYHRYHHVDTKIVRIFNTYGPRMRLKDGRVVPAFIGQALKGEPLTIFGDGSQTRSFCYVSDLIDGIFRLAMSDFHEPVNIGNPREMTIKQFAEQIQSITGTSSHSEYRPLPVDDPKVRQPDITRARTVLGWEPKVDFDTGIRQTIEYFRPRVG